MFIQVWEAGKLMRRLHIQTVSQLAPLYYFSCWCCSLDRIWILSCDVMHFFCQACFLRHVWGSINNNRINVLMLQPRQQIQLSASIYCLSLKKKDLCGRGVPTWQHQFRKSIHICHPCLPLLQGLLCCLSISRRKNPNFATFHTPEYWARTEAYFRANLQLWQEEKRAENKWAKQLK